MSIHSKIQGSNCKTEYDSLKSVVVCPPTHMRIGTVINETQKKYKSENIDSEVAMEQHRSFVRVLREHDVDVLELEAQPKLHEQVFTRDIGFAISDKMFVSAMGTSIRVPEVGVLRGLLETEGIPYQDFFQKSIEGGDVIIDKEIVWVGISTRTTYEAVDALKKLLPKHQVLALPLAERILHLDCAFNIIGPGIGLVYPEALTDKDLQLLRGHYELIEVTKEEQYTLATNVLSIGDKKVISMPQNKNANKAMSNLGYEIIEVDFSEIIKSGGSFRCCSMPILRA